jgi:hypothetical protein
MDIAQISILGWTILTLIVIAILLRYEGAKFLLDVALAGLIIVLLWTYWHRDRPNNHNGDGPANLLEKSLTSENGGPDLGDGVWAVIDRGRVL